jgi:hypothetical protein
VSRRPVATIDRIEMYRTNFSDWIEEGERDFVKKTNYHQHMDCIFLQS